MQKFFLGDLVRVADDLGKSMAHFPCGQDAIVLYSYSEKHCQSVAGDKQFGLYLLKDKQESAWYYENQLALIAEDMFERLPKTNVYRRSYDFKMARKQKMGNKNG